MENILVSACLLGVACRYDGKRKPNEAVIALKEKYNLIPVCPEIMGETVIMENGEDVTDKYSKGAEETLRLARLFGCGKAVLKEKSPSCGSGRIYDGTFSKTLTEGNGVTAGMLLANGIRVAGETEIDGLSD